MITSSPTCSFVLQAQHELELKMTQILERLAALSNETTKQEGSLLSSQPQPADNKVIKFLLTE